MICDLALDFTNGDEVIGAAAVAQSIETLLSTSQMKRPYIFIGTDFSEFLFLPMPAAIAGIRNKIAEIFAKYVTHINTSTLVIDVYRNDNKPKTIVIYIAYQTPDGETVEHAEEITL